NLIDTMLPKNIAISTAEYLLWKGNSIEFRSGTIDGKQTYYLSQKEVQKQVNSSEYALCALFSQHFGQVNSANLGAKSYAFLQIWLKPFFETRKLSTFSNQSLTSPLKKEDLNKTFTIENEIISITRYLYPLALDSCRALYFSYSSEAEEDEIELDHQSVALMYRSGNFGVSPWYWTSSKEIRTLYSPMEWQVIMAIQHYSIRNKIYPFFEHYE
ncbi:MAG: hypothetical protein LPK45_10160, partial [Bacteroidota bacterium]|nr:hypothetical protein [Bacteroidota bacterium]MDX5431456.1 hypothetical protein [Bacteroidota bacterium]MDX5470184.1 hypothetical protein [Bacteroidota bacterium]